MREENLTLNWPLPGQFNGSWATGQEHHGTRKQLGSSKGKPSPAAHRILLASQKVCKMPRARWNRFNTEASPTSSSWRDYPRHSCKGQAIKNKQAISNKAFLMLPFCEIRLCWQRCEVSFYGNLASLNYKWSCCGEASPLWFLNELYCYSNASTSIICRHLQIKSRERSTYFNFHGRMKNLISNKAW